MKNNLIYDIGMHLGEDTDFYLKKGFQVIAVEAHADLCEKCEKRFHQEINSGQLTIINKAISSAPGTISFYVNNDVSVWGTINIDWVERNNSRGTASHKVEVDATTIGDIMLKYDAPHYMKVDIEGADILCLKGLLNTDKKPEYISIESSATSIKDTFEQLNILEKLGYKKFKVISQKTIENQRCPNPAKEGEFADYKIQLGSSGLFGEETPGEWRSIASVKRQYIRYHFEAGLVGANNGIFRNIQNHRIKKILNTLFQTGGDWYDTHATF